MWEDDSRWHWTGNGGRSCSPERFHGPIAGTGWEGGGRKTWVSRKRTRLKKGWKAGGSGGNEEAENKTPKNKKIKTQQQLSSRFPYSQLPDQELGGLCERV